MRPPNMECTHARQSASAVTRACAESIPALGPGCITPSKSRKWTRMLGSTFVDALQPRDPSFLASRQAALQNLAMNQGDHSAKNSESHRTPPVVLADPEIMGGWACFVGTRVPASMVVGMVDSGTPWSQLVADYPFLTQDHIAAARAYLAAPEALGKEPTNWLELPAKGESGKGVRVARRDERPSSDK